MLVLCTLFVLLASTQSQLQQSQGCYEANIDFPGNDLPEQQIKGVTSWAKCQEKCEKNSACHGWTYGTTDLKIKTWAKKTCYLKDDKYLTGKTRLEGAISGPKRCTGCYKANIDFLGNDLPGQQIEGVTSWVKCQEKCEKNSACHGWTYGTTDLKIKTWAIKRCYLKDDKYLTGKTGLVGAISGPKRCPGTPSCHKVDIDYRGHDLGGQQIPNVRSWWDCKKLCEASIQCYGWTYGTKHLIQRQWAKKICYLKDDKYLTGKTGLVGAISGPKRCPVLPADFQADFPADTRKDLNEIYHE